jgi:hypothetical protein
MYYFIDVESYGDVQRHIIHKLSENSFVSFPMTSDNPNMVSYLAWLAEGNTPEPWEV